LDDVGHGIPLAPPLETVNLVLEVLGLLGPGLSLRLMHRRLIFLFLVHLVRLSFDSGL
jgi:hypothetical protein